MLMLESVLKALLPGTNCVRLDVLGGVLLQRQNMHLDPQDATITYERHSSRHCRRGFLASADAAVLDALVLEHLTHLHLNLAHSFLSGLDGAHISFPYLHKASRAKGSDLCFKLRKTCEPITHLEIHFSSNRGFE